MTSTKTLSKHYDVLEPMERLRLVISAKSRGDEQEVQRLRESCPRKTYSMPDAAFQDRLEAQEHLAHVVLIDLTYYLAKLNVVDAYALAGPYLIETSKDVAITAYLQGYEEGWRAQWRALRKKGEPGQPQWDDGRFAQRLETVSEPPRLLVAIAEDLTDRFRVEFARGVRVVWEGFDQFCREELELDAKTVMQAAFPPILERIAQKAEILDCVEVDPDDVHKSAELCRQLWRELVGLDE